MTALRQAIDDYIALRRSLGFKLRRMSEGLREFGVFLEQRAAPYVTTAPAMEWAMLPTHHQPSDWAQRLGSVRVFARHWHATDPRTEIPPTGLLPFSATTRPTLSVFGTGDSELVGGCIEVISQPGPSTSDIPLPLRTVGGCRFTYQRGAQAGAAGCGSRRGHPQHPPSKVRQDPPGSASHFHSGRHG